MPLIISNSKKSVEKLKDKQKQSLPTWAIVLIVIISVLLFIILMFIGYKQLKKYAYDVQVKKLIEQEVDQKFEEAVDLLQTYPSYSGYHEISTKGGSY